MIPEKVEIQLANGKLVTLSQKEIADEKFYRGWTRGEAGLGDLNLRGKSLIGWHAYTKRPMALHVTEELIHAAFLSKHGRGISLTGILQSNVKWKRQAIETTIARYEQRLKEFKERLLLLQSACTHPSGIPCNDCAKK